MSTLEQDPVRLYLKLMKKALSYSLWSEPGIPLEILVEKRVDIFITQF